MDYNDYLASTIDKHADLINEYRLGDLATALYNTPGIVQYGYADVLHDIVNLMIEEDPENVFSKGLPFMFKNIDCPNHVKMDLRGISGTCGITQSKLRNGITIYCDEIPFGFLTNTLVNGVIRIVGAKTLMP